MNDATPAYWFTPARHPVGQVVWHMPAPISTAKQHLHDGSYRWTARTLCGRVAFASVPLDPDTGRPTEPVGRPLEPATYTRVDHARALGPLCEQCARAARA